MKEFYRIRGDFAHGKLKSRQPTAWQPLEHIVLATIAFPLVVKVLLSKTGFYSLSEHDQATIDAFERISDEDFLNPPPDQEGSIDSWVSRITRETRWDMAKKELIGELKTHLQTQEDVQTNGKE
jgi:hypothetical protein